MWNARYDRPEYLFGTEPADFLRRHADVLAPGSRVLAVADGEGRNSVWLAQQGHRVVACDTAELALEKARALARARGVEVDIRAADILRWDWQPAAFDAVVAIFIQFLSPPERAAVLAGIARTIVPGGLLLLHGYAPRQVEYRTGGPPVAENMYTLPMLRAAFSGWKVLHEADYDADIQEGRGHAGRSGLIDFIARKPGETGA